MWRISGRPAAKSLSCMSLHIFLQDSVSVQVLENERTPQKTYDTGLLRGTSYLGSWASQLPRYSTSMRLTITIPLTFLPVRLKPFQMFKKYFSKLKDIRDVWKGLVISHTQTYAFVSNISIEYLQFIPLSNLFLTVQIVNRANNKRYSHNVTSFVSQYPFHNQWMHNI